MSVFEITDIVIISSISFLIAALYYHTKSFGDWSTLPTRELTKKMFLDIF